ncbi:hypothetical protein LOD99_3746 [Oopsacas minuta]|uniref:Ribosomal protein/NADH dehydrogenase domain-containing protein n=1 Tax=Oopsacas minuta TaxID=111878 RepID=A0AAV7JX13_9METZ|nr:hypothetical protein LOD99_3746 [Oopsacas minuta]
MANLGTQVLKSISKQNRTYEYLSKWPVKLPKKVKVIKLFLASSDTPAHKHPGAKFFLIECIPQLKFSNPDNKINVLVEDRKKSNINIEMESGESHLIHISFLSRDDIKLKIEELCQQLEQKPQPSLD